MELKVIGSSSAGNCYILESENEALIIEAGLPFIEVKKALNFNLTKVAGCIITHEHGDHAKHAKAIADAGIKVMASHGTMEASKIGNHHNAVPINMLKRTNAGGFKLLPFPVNHDAAEPCGYLINHKECGKVLFITDTSEIDYDFDGLNNIIIEANYGEEITETRIMEGKLNAKHQERVSKSHLSIEKCIQFFNRTDLKKVNNIVLIHLSDKNSNEQQFKNAVVNATGKKTHVADKGMTINFNKTAF